MNSAVIPTSADADKAAAAATQLAENTYQLALAYTVDSPEMYALATEELRAIATRKAELTEKRMSLTRPLDAVKAGIMDLFRGPLARLEEADQLLRGAALDWKRAEDEKARKAQAEAEAVERARLAEIERQRREAEDAERKAREVAQAALAKGDTAAFTLAAKLADERAAEREEAEEAQQLAEVAPVHVPAVAAPKAAGVAGRVTWKAEVVDLAELVKSAAEALARGDDTLLGYLQADTSALGQVAKALKAKARVPGVRFYAEESLAVRRR